MKYISTRGQVKNISFKQAVMMGLAEDGGLLLPETIPHLTPGDLDALAKLAYPELAFQVMSYFIEDIPAADLKTMIDRAYSSFTHPDITPVVHQDGLYILELFHGPTLAFKDVALQFLGNMFEYLLAESGKHMNILGATSGDTGSAAIYGVRGKKNINIFILHPHKKVSQVQELQMTTVTDANVFNLAIKGTFDDGQQIVKETFGDLEFKKKYALGAVNSINWARILAQVVYYFYAWGQVRKQTGADKVYFSIPTGNFGDIFAGYIAKRMGLPIEKLVLATNANNILSRFINDGDYSTGEVHPTFSPSMDIQNASNLERYLFYLFNEDSDRLASAMQQFAETGQLAFTDEQIADIREAFLSDAVDNEQTLTTIRDFHNATGYILDPHTATGVKVGKGLAGGEYPVVCLATAHPAKFPEAVNKAVGSDPERPTSLDGLEEREQRCETIDASTDTIKSYLARNAL
ncbi:MAG: threonine synthase [Deltaproteobacteria bacterium]|nr:MAG: threonine synthase [Deltaproteobacteria bacterium]